MKKIAVLALAVILFFTMATAAAAAGLPVDDGAYNLLLLGIDTRDPENWDGCRTDTIIIATILKGENEIKFTSLMRDTYLEIPGKGYGRINAAYACGGAELTVKTIQHNFGVSADDYIVFDFDFVRSLCDALGGITVKMNASEVRVMNRAYPGAGFTVGKNELDGDKTLTFCRIRKGCGNDFERTRRQRDVLKILFSKIPAIGRDGLLSLTRERYASVKTSIDARDFIGWGALLYQMRGAHFSDIRIPVDGAYRNRMIKGAAILLPNMPRNLKALERFLDLEARRVSPPETLKKGSSGEAVGSLQDELIRLGFMAGIASGVYDQPTADAVKKFQRASGISADGVAGPETLGFLYGTWL
jgi:LCP family protein required for cell wall assembly